MTCKFPKDRLGPFMAFQSQLLPALVAPEAGCEDDSAGGTQVGARVEP